ncbi:hypothetical protein KOW79_010934 [Hemibagrus wyckioides]|uniref:Uncharacterized protein n=1 Tax=Hemibagrus wyckioides TaxID=337641 RepID=A0A9D3NPX8_9TELE|nr:uncharacterized protein LOC131362975 [Hemibagrus wyckioides]KAG7326009.1 hypothetical protein KOW79_010934 [Hemibagrus wyckioides]
MEWTFIRLYSSDLYKIVLKNTGEAVIIPLKGGISSLNEVCQALIEADVDPITGKCSNYDYIRQQIVQAHQFLEQSEQAASSGLQSLDENLERLIQDEMQLNWKMNEINQTLDQLGTEQDSNEKLLREYQRITGVGTGLFNILIIGWNNNKRKVTYYKSKISQTERHLSQKDDELKQTHEEVQKMRKLVEFVTEFQEKVRSAVNLLGILSGKVIVAEHQTRRFILQEHVIKMMEDVMKAIEQITGNELLYGNDLPRLINQMKDNNQHLATICASENSSN